jgi:hypothetical protein
MNGEASVTWQAKRLKDRVPSLYRENRNTPRADDNTKVLPDSVTLLSPLSRPVYMLSNAMVGHAARVHANAGPAVSVSPDSRNVPLQMLQSARVERRPSSANVRT